VSTARAQLERHFAPEVLAALDAYVQELVEERLAEAEPHDDGRRWYRLEEAADLLGCSYDAIRMRVARGRLTTRRQGRTVYVSGDSLRSLRVRMTPIQTSGRRAAVTADALATGGRSSHD
jgi:excisionase family DNA binding protein